jgi:hypothetical protein
MNNSVESESRNEDSSFEPEEKKTGFSEMDIIRKAYELILENSDFFFSELIKAFTLERDFGHLGEQIKNPN